MFPALGADVGFSGRRGPLIWLSMAGCGHIGAMPSSPRLTLWERGRPDAGRIALCPAVLPVGPN